jgi:endogenous inhibitor of DNA gyrase (YacG/DUF329 family)
VTTVSCPTCQRKVEWSDESPWRPFCSERCKLLDLGAWFTEQRGIPGEELPTGVDDESSSAAIPRSRH